MIRKVVFITPLFFLFTILVSAQQRDYFTINPGEKPAEEIPDSLQYAYPAFIKGYISFRDTRNGTVQLNYNYLFEEMMFLNNTGDTLAIADAPTIRQITIKTDTFYFSNVFVKQIATFGEIKLAQRQYFGVVNSLKIGSYGQTTSAPVVSYKSANTATGIKSLTVQEVVNLKKVTQFYIADKFNNFQLVNKKSLPDLFPKKSKIIKTYLKDNNVNFTREEDIKGLLAFLQSN